MQGGRMESRNEAGQSSPVLCAKNCGFYGNPATQNLCSKCYRDYLKEEQLLAAAAAATIATGVANSTTQAAPSSEVLSTNPFPCFGGDAKASPAAQEDNPPRKKNRCECCNKKTGITGFTCRCGGVFCGLHRYPEEHRCKNDYKAQGRTVIANQNPLCVKDKMDNRI